MPDRRWLVVSLHDVAPCTADVSRAWMRHLEALELNVSLLVVPGPWRRTSTIESDDDLVGWLRELTRGPDARHELVQHGWDHTAAPRMARSRRGPRVRAINRVVARGCGEFWTIGREDAARRLLAGRSVLTAAGLPACGFVAPAWLMSPGAHAAVRELGFRYTTTHRQVIDLVQGTTIGCLALSQRAENRLAGLAASLTLAGVRRAVDRDAPIRLAVHPDDLVDRRAMRSVLAACEQVLAAGYRSLTYANLLDTHQRQDAMSDERTLSADRSSRRGG